MIIAWLLFLMAVPGALAASNTLTLAPGLQAIEQDCHVGGRIVQLRELRLQPGKGLELRALANPAARPNNQCRDGYGGPDFETLLRTGPPNNMEILGAVNGTVFRETSTKPPGYVSNSLVWSKETGLLAPWRRGGGGSIFVADAHGGHRFEIDPKKASDIVRQLQTRFPSMTLAVQSNMPLMDGKLDERGRFSHWSHCADPNSSDWRCRNLARTLLCSRTDGSLSLLTTPQAFPFDLADGLRVGGACHVDCVTLYNLDGGRSTQMARRENGKLELSGQRIETTQEGCSPYRPVSNYLIVVKSGKKN